MPVLHMPAEGDSTSAGNQSMRVVTFKAVPGTARTYYYHRDHLGSTTLITNESGEVVQRVEYLPTGETFIEQQDTSWVSPHKFNGRSALRDAFFLRCTTKASKLERRAKRGKKELDEETGLYYYGARYYDPRLSMWLGTDPMQEDCKGKSTHNCYKRHIYEKVYDAKTFAKYLDVYDRGWKKSNNGKPIVILHSCKTSDFAKKLSSSAEFKDVYVIAPNAVLNSSILGESVAGGGLWLVYRNGEQVKGNSGKPITYDSNAQVGTIGFDYGF